MITESQIYWITRLDGIRDLCIGVLCASVMFAVVSIIWNCMELDVGLADVPTALRKFVRKVLGASVCIILSAVGLVFIPTTKEMAMIKIIPAIANSKVASEDLPRDAREIYNLAKKALVKKLSDEDEGKKK